MLKLAVSIALSLLLLFLVKEGYDSLRTDDITGDPVATEKRRQPLPAPSQTAMRGEFYPSVPTPLPDLYEGYLFNEERLLETEEEVDETETAPPDSTGDELNVDMDSVYYMGSIIMGDMRKGLISYPEPKAKPSTPVSRRGRTTPRLPTRSTETNYAQLVVGDTLSGYKVIAVETNRLVLQKGGETLEKLLHDSAKVRATPPPLPVKEKNVPPPQPEQAEATKRKRVELDRAIPAGSRVVTSTKVAAGKGSTPTVNIKTPGVPFNRR